MTRSSTNQRWEIETAKGKANSQLKTRLKEMWKKVWKKINDVFDYLSYWSPERQKRLEMADYFCMSQVDFYDENRLDKVREKIKSYYDALQWEEKPDYEAFFYAMVAYGRLHEFNRFKSPYIWVVDFSKPNTQHRFYIINLYTLQVENALCTWHWVNSWKWEIPTQFSNEKWSLQSSLWAFLTSWELESNKKWTWKWLRLRWQEHTDFRAHSRWLFIHPGGVDQSEWCFTIPYEQDSQEVYDIIKKLEWNCLVYAYYSEDHLKDSRITNPTRSNVFRMHEMVTHDVTDFVKSSGLKTKSKIKNVLLKDKKDKKGKDENNQDKEE